MLYLYSGTHRETVREKMNAAVEKAAKGGEVVRITDAHTPDDMRSALAGPGMFSPPAGGSRIIVFDGILGNVELREIFLKELEHLRDSNEIFFIFDEKPDAATRKQIEKYAEKSEKFDAAKGKGDTNTIFALANALRSGNKKELWIAYQRELLGSAPEAIHGVLFWGAKDMLMKSRDAKDIARARRYVAELAELPHEARRQGEELDYALERFVLSRV